MAITLDQTYIDPELEQDGQRVFGALLDNLQCNILKSHGRQWAFHIFLRFTGEPEAVRNWIKDFTEQYVTSAATQLRQSEVYKERQKAALERQQQQLRLEQLQADMKLMEQLRASSTEGDLVG